MPSYYIDNNTGERVEVKKTHRIRNFVVLPLSGLFVLVIVGSALSSPTNEPGSPVNSNPSPAATPTPNSVGASTVEIVGSGEAMISVFTGGSSSNTVQLPHTLELPEGMVSVSASRSPSAESYMRGKPDTGELRCRIIRGGEVVDDQSAAGEYASVTCTKYR